MTSMPSPRPAKSTGVDLSTLERVPPHDLAAEQSVLGAMMISADAIADVTETLQPRDYYRHAHETVHQVVLHLYTQGEPVDPITVSDELTKRGELTQAGGNGYLMELVQAVPTAANAEYYARIVHERAVLRRLATCGTRITQAAQNVEGDLDDIRNHAERELHDAVAGHDRDRDQGKESRDAVPLFWDAMDARRSRDGQLTGVPTGLSDLNSLTEGFQPGQLIIVAARPAMGKSVLALNFLRAASIQSNLRTAFYSLEMTLLEIMERLYSAEAKVGLHHIKAGALDDNVLQRMARRTPAIEDAPFTIDDSANLTLTEIRTRARRLQQQKGLDLLIVDYLQLMEGGSGRYASRQEEVSVISRGLKLLAKELEIPVIALSQLNRGPEQRADRKPMVSDLRESGSIEQDADMVILLHREDAYEKESPRAGEADLIVAKHRNGPTATITVAFQGHYSRFVNMESEL